MNIYSQRCATWKYKRHPKYNKKREREYCDTLWFLFIAQLLLSNIVGLNAGETFATIAIAIRGLTYFGFYFAHERIEYESMRKRLFSYRTNVNIYLVITNAKQILRWWAPIASTSGKIRRKKNWLNFQLCKLFLFFAFCIVSTYNQAMMMTMTYEYCLNC